jgi:hypothetical protein
LSSFWARIVEEKKRTAFVLFAKKKTQKIKKEENGVYLQTPTFATTLKLLLPLHS